MPWVAAALLAVSQSPQANAQPPPPPVEPVYLTAAQLFEAADRALAAGDTKFAEQALLALTTNPDVLVRSEARFRLAKHLALREQRRDAALLLRRLLDEQPEARAARLELAGLLQQLGDEDGALRQLRALRTSDLPPNVARFVDRLTASLQASRPLGFQVEFALAPNSNINRATTSDTLGTIFGDFEIDQKKRSGIGAAIRGLAQGRLELAKEARLVARASSEAKIYGDSQFNDIFVDAAVGPEFRLGRTRLALETGATRQWFGMKGYSRSLRLAGSVTRPVDAVSQLRLDTGVRWSNNRVNDLHDGRGLSLRARYERALSPTLLVAASIGADRFKANDDAYSTRAWNAGLSAYRDVNRMTLGASIEVGRLKGDDRLALLPEPREDRFLRLQLSSVFRQYSLAGFAPVTRLIIERNKSNVAFYDFKSTRTEVGISRAF